MKLLSVDDNNSFGNSGSILLRRPNFNPNMDTRDLIVISHKLYDQVIHSRLKLDGSKSKVILALKLEHERIVSLSTQYLFICMQIGTIEATKPCIVVFVLMGLCAEFIWFDMF